jgi:hypothetical protein
MNKVYGRRRIPFAVFCTSGVLSFSRQLALELAALNLLSRGNRPDQELWLQEREA